MLIPFTVALFPAAYHILDGAGFVKTKHNFTINLPKLLLSKPNKTAESRTKYECKSVKTQGARMCERGLREITALLLVAT